MKSEIPEIWYADRYMNVIRLVAAKYKRDRLNFMRGVGCRFFDTEKEAVEWKRGILIAAVEGKKRALIAAERHLKSFDKKFGDVLI